MKVGFYTQLVSARRYRAGGMKDRIVELPVHRFRQLGCDARAFNAQLRQRLLALAAAFERLADRAKKREEVGLPVAAD
jgi:hypothetical protein